MRGIVGGGDEGARPCDGVGRVLTRGGVGWAGRGESKVARAVSSSLKYARFLERALARLWTAPWPSRLVKS